MRLSESVEQLKYYQGMPYVPTVKKVCGIALEAIETLQQENERLRAKLDDWKHEVQCHMDEVIARDKEKEQGNERD